MAAALAVIPAGRKVAGVQSVPRVSRCRGRRRARASPRARGSAATPEPTCGIWIRWSINASPANPASSAASAIARTHPPGSSPQGNRDSWSTTRGPPGGEGDRVRSTTARRAGVSLRWGTPSLGEEESQDTTSTWSQPSASSPAETAAARRTWSARTFAGTGRSRSALRRRHSWPGVSRATATAGSPAARAASRHAVRRPASRPSVSTTVVRPRPMRAATMRSRRSKASAEASRSAGPEPTTSRRCVGGDDLDAAVATGRPRGLARSRGADEDDDGGIWQGHVRDCDRSRRRRPRGS